MPWPCAVRTAVLALAAALAGSAFAIAYTVQVVAVSDQDTAINISRELLRDGYPAYVVRSTGAQGDVFRVRVGAFANRAAAARYAGSMPPVGGSQPVPALAEAIPQGIMPLAPRLLWQDEPGARDVRVVPWPAGVALRLQSTDPVRQAEYVIFQDGAERRLDAWAAYPLGELPGPRSAPEFDVPIVDLTVAPPVEPEADERALAVEPDESLAPPHAAEDEAAVDLEPSADAFAAVLALVLAPDADAPEAGVLLLRDRALWPPSWETDGDDVRDAFRTSLATIVARELELDPALVVAAAYLPAGSNPPSLIVLDAAEPGGRDGGVLVALADPTRGVQLEGPRRIVGSDAALELPDWPSERIRVSDEPLEGDLGGSEWRVSADAGFVRITLPDGATWRAGVGTPVWSDGRSVIAWDGERLLLYDFVWR